MMKSENGNVRRTSGLPWILVGVLACAASSAYAANLEPKESEDLLAARQLYKSGKYQEAADIFSRLSAAHPDIPTFARNAGAAYYYLKKPDPALSNLREYLRVQKKLTAEDRQEVDKWIAEMEQLRAQAPAPAPAAPAGSSAAAGPPMGVPLPGAVPVPGAPGLPSSSGPAAGQPAMPAPGGVPAAPAYPGYYPYGVAPGQPTPGQPTAAPGYPPGYGYPAPGAPATDPAAAPAGQPYGAGYPYGYAAAPQPGAPVPVVQGGVVEQAQPVQKPKSALPWVIGGAGIAALAMGGVFTYLYRDAFADTETRYNPDRESAGKTYSYLQFVGYGLGVAGITTAIILLAKSDAGATGTTVSLTPAVGPRLAGAELAVRY